MTVALVLLGLGLLLAVLGWVQMIGSDWLGRADASWEAEARRLLPELYDEDRP